MSPRRIAAVVALAFAPSGATSLVAQAAWPIKRFEVVNVEPSGDVRDDGALAYLFEQMVRAFRTRSPGIDPDFPSLFQGVPLDPFLKTTIEDYLHDASVQLEAWGFPAPALDPIVTTASGESAYRVYLVDQVPNATAEYRGACEDATERVMLLGVAEMLTGGQLNLGGHEALGHELFHAVQGATPFHQCATGFEGGWILEGSAKAIGFDLIKMTRPNLLIAPPGTARWGPRDYTLTLPVPSAVPGTTLRERAYGTSSWWRYLAEYAAALGDAGTPPGPEENPVDYGYLAHMLQQGPVPRDCGAVGASCDSEMVWLDAGTGATLNRSLRDVFANFAQVVPLYGDHREAGTPDEGMMTGAWWRRSTFEATSGCPRVSLLPPRASAVHRDRVPRFHQSSIQCFNVVAGGFDSDALVSVRIDGPPGQVALEDLTAAIAGRPIESERAEVRETAGTGALNTTWVFEIPASDSSYVVLTNLADDPTVTVDLEELPITFRVEGHASMTDGGVGSSGGPSGPDIDRALSIDMDTVMRAQLFVIRDTLCRVQFEFQNSSTGDGVSLMMNHVGPILPGDYPIFNPGRSGTFDMRYIEANPGTSYVGFAFGPGNGMTSGFTYGYIGRGGTLTLDLVSPRLVRGSISVTGDRNVCLDRDGRPSSLANRFECPAPDGMGARAVFSTVPRGAAGPRPSSTCFAPPSHRRSEPAQPSG